MPEQQLEEKENEIKANLGIRIVRQKLLVRGDVLNMREIYGLTKREIEDEIHEMNQGEPVDENSKREDEKAVDVQEGRPVKGDEEANGLRNDLDQRKVGAIANAKKGRKDEENPESMCVICLSQESDTLIFPCGHLCLCSNCSDVVKTQTKMCPVCRTKIQSILPINVQQMRQ